MTLQGTRLRALPASRIIAAVADASQRWADADFPPRVRATRAVMERLQYSEPVVDYALDRLFGPVTVAALQATIADELGSVDALDGFVPRRGRPDVYARGVEHVTIVSSDTTIGVALWPALLALCAKCNVVVKDRSDDLLARFAQTLYEENDTFRDAFRTFVWDANGMEPPEARLDGSDVVVAFGRNESLAAIRARCRADAQFYGFGHRTSAAYVERETLATEERALQVARAIARDATVYDGDGCLSLHIAFVERAGRIDPRAFSELVERAWDDAAVEFPAMRALDPRSRALQSVLAFRVAQTRADMPRLRDYVLAYDPPAEETPALIPRSLYVYPIDGPADAVSLLDRHALPLEAFGVADPPSARGDVISAALASGASRVGRLGDLQSPGLASNHGGFARIGSFVRWIVCDA